VFKLLYSRYIGYGAESGDPAMFENKEGFEFGWGGYKLNETEPNTPKPRNSLEG
jgi:hypothetical protein